MAASHRAAALTIVYSTQRVRIISENNIRVALVPGGSGEIGRVVAERLARDGVAVAVHYAGNKPKADEVVAAIESAGGSAISVGGYADGHSPVLGRQRRRDHHKACGGDAARTPRSTRRHRRGSRFLGGPARWINGQVIYANGGAV